MLLNDIVGTLSKLDRSVVNLVVELIKTIAEAPADRRQEIAARALKSAAARAATIAFVNASLKRLK